MFTILSFFAISCLLVSPLRNVPVIDDWTYAWSVENLIRTGRLAVLDWSVHYPVAQVLWGSIFSFLFGFSFGALRLSTVLLAALGCMTFYLTLREMGLESRRSLLGALMLGANPVFFVLSFSFMTDVPFLSLMNLAMLFYIAGLKRERTAWLWIGGLFAVGAFLVRQIGFVIPLALLPSLAQREGGWPRRWHQLLSLAASCLGMGILWLWMWKSLGGTSTMAERFEGMRHLLLVSPQHYLDRNIDLLLQVSFAIFPLLLAGISFRPRWWPATIAGLALGGGLLLWWHLGEVPSPITGETWGLQELAIGRQLIRGDLTAPGLMSRFSLPARAGMLIAVAVLVAGAARLLFKARGRMSSPAMIIIAQGLLQLALINMLWLYYDRYYLVLLPSLIYLSLKLIRETQFSHLLALGGLVLLSFISISGTWDALRFNQACLDAYHDLRAGGVPATKIDAGYSLNGWLLYAHPENLPSGFNPAQDVPFVTTDEMLPYVVSNVPLAGYEVLKEISWRGSLWAVSNRVYVLHRQEGQSTRAP